MPDLGKTPHTTKDEIRRAFDHHLSYHVDRASDLVTDQDRFGSLGMALRKEILDRWTRSRVHQSGQRRVSYLSMEFLMGRTLSNLLLNLDLEDSVREMLLETGNSLEAIEEAERDPGLGNGGLGRLAACFMESLATLGIPAYGYGLRYEYGMFRQQIVDGFQIEKPDDWLNDGNPWEVFRPELRYTVRFYGTIHYHRTDGRVHASEWVDTHDVVAVAYDTPVPGYRNNTVNTLRLWSALADEPFDLNRFNDGDFLHASEQKVNAENITKVLYPKDNMNAGKELRLKQEYLFVSATLQDIMSEYRENHEDLDGFSDAHVIQLNDTHPALAIPEFMRLLVDMEGMEWEDAWGITCDSFAFTNHTVLPEALEQWSVGLLGHVLPRHLQIIYEINRNFMREVGLRYLGDLARQNRMSIVSEEGEKAVRMAHLAIVGSKSTNGVAALHSNILKEQVFHDFYRFWPEKFHNVTNGITPRRWLRACNPELSRLISERLGDGWVTDLNALRGLEDHAEDPRFTRRWHEIKQQNKTHLAQWVQNSLGVELDTNAMFDCQIKRIHEYKRQLLNVLHVITLYNRIKANGRGTAVPRVVFFAGKAAPGYDKAKLIIKLITAVGDTVNSDPDVGNALKVLFLPDYSVSMAERVIPAADLSEQISTAGKEASGTGNMKFALNGALTVGTRDGANIEIAEEVGEENMFMFGLTSEEVRQSHLEGYNPLSHYHENEELRLAMDMVDQDAFSPEQPDLFKPLTHELLYEGDQYMLLADFAEYVAIQESVSDLYGRTSEWNRTSVLNCAGSGRFSSDRAIGDYSTNIWDLGQVRTE